MTDTRALLERYNPLLVTLPERPDTLHPPGKWATWGASRGDYHPISAELFIAHATLQTKPMPRTPLLPWLSRLAGLPLFWGEPDGPRGDAVRREIEAAAHPDLTRLWFLDVSRVPSQRRKRAWAEYARILQRTEAAARARERVVYGRLWERDGRRALQYWYLYLYNDFHNKHEGDWEQATIELNANDEPVRVGYSAHEGGWRRAWDEVKRERETRRPLLFVARGSHAGYFGYAERGWDPGTARVETRTLSGVNMLAGALSRIGRALNIVRDRPPAAERADVEWKPQHTGLVVTPALRVLPDGPEPWLEPGFWWMRFRGRWGSAHPRLNGTIGVESPWARQTIAWTDPVAWLDRLRPSPVRTRRGRLVDLDAVLWEGSAPATASSRVAGAGG